MLFAVIQAFVITVTDIQFIYAKRCKLGTLPYLLNNQYKIWHAIIILLESA